MVSAFSPDSCKRHHYTLQWASKRPQFLLNRTTHRSRSLFVWETFLMFHFAPDEGASWDIILAHARCDHTCNVWRLWKQHIAASLELRKGCYRSSNSVFSRTSEMPDVMGEGHSWSLLESGRHLPLKFGHRRDDGNCDGTAIPCLDLVRLWTVSVMKTIVIELQLLSLMAECSK